MKLKRKLLAGLLTLCMAVGMAVPAFAENGPSSGDMSAAWVQLYDSSVEEPDGSILVMYFIATAARLTRWRALSMTRLPTPSP